MPIRGKCLGIYKKAISGSSAWWDSDVWIDRQEADSKRNVELALSARERRGLTTVLQ